MYAGERRIELGDIFTAGLCHVGTTAAAAADEFGGITDEVAGVHPAAKEILRDGGHQHRLLVDHRAQRHHAAAQFIAEEITELAQGVHITGVDLGG